MVFKSTTRIIRSWDCLIEVFSYVPILISVWGDRWTYAYLSLKKLHRPIQVETKVCVDHFSYIRNCNYLRVWQLNVSGLQLHVYRCGYFMADWSFSKSSNSSLDVAYHSAHVELWQGMARFDRLWQQVGQHIWFSAR